jgi:hypothetical protein
MIRHVAVSMRAAEYAPMTVGWGRREPPIHGRQDKSAGRGWPHVVGGIEVFGNVRRRRAGALPININGFNGPSAISRVNVRTGRR